MGLWLAGSIVVGSATIDTSTGVIVSAGYFLGALVGEVRSTWARPAGPRSATLATRRESDYVPSWARLWPTVLTVVAVPLTLVLAVRIDWQALLLGAAAVIPWAAGRWSTRLIVERPLPVAGQDVIDADAGLRSRALHAIGGAVCLVESWVVIALVTLLLAGDDLPQSNSGLALLAVLAMLAALSACVVVGLRPFLVVHPPDADAATSAGAPSPEASRADEPEVDSRP